MDRHVLSSRKCACASQAAASRATATGRRRHQARSRLRPPACLSERYVSPPAPAAPDACRQSASADQRGTTRSYRDNALSPSDSPSASTVLPLLCVLRPASMPLRAAPPSQHLQPALLPCYGKRAPAHMRHWKAHEERRRLLRQLSGLCCGSSTHAGELDCRAAFGRQSDARQSDKATAYIMPVARRSGEDTHRGSWRHPCWAKIRRGNG